MRVTHAAKGGADLKAGTSIWNTSQSRRCRASLLVAAEGPPSARAQITVSSSVRPAAFRSSFCARLSGWSGSSDWGDGYRGPAKVHAAQKVQHHAAAAETMLQGWSRLLRPVALPAGLATQAPLVQGSLTATSSSQASHTDGKGYALGSITLLLCSTRQVTSTGLTGDASPVELCEAKVVQLDDELPGLLIPEAAQQDAARPQRAVRDATLVAER